MSPYTVIDSDNYAAAGIQAFFFAGGEPHVRIPQMDGRYLLWLKLRTWNDVGIATMLLEAIFQQREGVEAEENNRIEAFVPYFPGARQDRSDGFTPLTKDVVGMMLQYAHIPLHTFDMHSQNGHNFVRNWLPSDLDLSALRDRYDGIIAPDSGARGRAQDFADALGLKEVLVAEKRREFGTGKILDYSIYDVREHHRYLVVDDICDGGATFNILADAIPANSQADLWVSHGIFSRGVEALSHVYDKIYTTDSWCIGEGDTGRVALTSLTPLFDKIMES